MEKTQLKEKVQKHVDSLFLTLSQNLDVQVSEDVQNRFTNWLSQEAFDVLLAQKKQGLIDATEQMFTELQNDLEMTFREQTKSDLLEILLAEAGVSFEDNPTEIKPKDASSDKPEIHSEEKSEAEANTPQAADEAVQEAELKEDKPEAQEKLPQVAETNAPQAADEAVQKADKVTTNENTGKPWTEECHDPEIIRKVNETFAQYFAEDFGNAPYSRDMKVLKIYDFNRQSRDLFRNEIEELFGIKLGRSVLSFCSFWETMGDIYDSVLYCLKQKENKQEQEAETNAPQVADETVQKADKVVTNKNSGKPWTEECRDPEIIQKVNKVFAQYHTEDINKEQYSRDMKVEQAFASNSSKRESFGRDIEGMFSIRFGKSVYSFWETLGDVYDSVLYCLKQGIVERQTSGEIDKQKVYGVKKLWGDYKVDPSDSSPKVRKIVDKVNQALVDKLGIDKMQITRESRFKDDLGADSLDQIEFIMECERDFNFSISDDVSEQIQTVGDAYDYLYYRMKE